MTKTVSLSTALKLKEAGWVKETEYYYVPDFPGTYYHFHLFCKSQIKEPYEIIGKISAPGIELLEELPKEIVKDGDEYVLTIVMVNTGCEISYNHQYLGETIRLHPVSGENIFEALAELVILKLTGKL